MNSTVKNVLIIENKEKEYNDIRNCLPSTITHEYKNSVRDCEELIMASSAFPVDGNVAQYDLLIADLINTVSNAKSHEILEAITESMKVLSALYENSKCKLIIITKLPVYALKNHFATAINEHPEIGILFSGNKDDLFEQLNFNIRSMFLLYSRGNVMIITKPYNCDGNNLNDIEQWREELKKLLNEIIEQDEGIYGKGTSKSERS
jgi:hypothetical protein